MDVGITLPAGSDGDTDPCCSYKGDKFHKYQWYVGDMKAQGIFLCADYLDFMGPCSPRRIYNSEVSCYSCSQAPWIGCWH